jgi:DNA (cytosine-5)-methyltransferase 1
MRDVAGVTETSSVTSGLVLSVFTGAGLLDRGFELEGYCVVSAGDVIWGRDVRDFQPSRHVFEGIIAGSPCQDFSKARRSPPTGNGLLMMAEFRRIVLAAEPSWWLLENVPQVPDMAIDGYKVQRLNLNAKECGCRQNRPRCFQFGSRDGFPLVIDRGEFSRAESPCAMATEGKRQQRRTFADFCELQGLPRTFDLPGWSQAMRYKFVGNGVPVPMARVVAGAIKRRAVTRWQRLCVCRCGRLVRSGRTLATAACRKRMQRARDASSVSEPGRVTPPAALLPLPCL